MRQEFARARSIHESLFPEPYDDGFVRFEYAYRPMRELGGDYVHMRVSPQGLVHLTLIDVTGHGLAAALTVNRLYGELERIHGENPQTQPGEVLELLNRYIYLTLAHHDIFATAACFMLDPYLSRLSYANAGHPPAYLRGANGVVTTLGATTYLLGATGGDEFTANQRVIEMSPGDAMVCYTDGAFEGRDRLGNDFGLKALEELMHRQPPPRNWPQYITAAVEKHTAGRSDDDVLVGALTFLTPRPQESHAAQAVAVS
jgi:serine phosphatase RsbU (regulator of sigma subunit)